MKKKKANVPAGNRTGFLDKGELAKQTVLGAREGRPSSAGNEETLNEARLDYITGSGPVGTMPSMSDMMEAMMKTVVKQPGKLLSAAGKMPHALGKADLVTTFLDKMGERLAFERTGVRLYEALLGKVEAFGGKGQGPSAEDVRHIRDEEFAHFEMLQEIMSNFGSDPSVMTPCADTSAVAGSGVLKVVSDPRANLAQSLAAVLTAELTDEAGWELLIELAEGIGFKKEAERFRGALEEEGEHVVKVKAWLTSLLTGAEAAAGVSRAA